MHGPVCAAHRAGRDGARRGAAATFLLARSGRPGQGFGVDDELEAGLKQRDAGFIVRVILRLAVLALVVVWGVHALGDHHVGSCVADGFRAVTGEPAPPPTTTAEDGAR